MNNVNFQAEKMRCGIGLVFVASVLLLVLAWLYHSLSFASVVTVYVLSAIFVSVGSVTILKNRGKVEER